MEAGSRKRDFASLNRVSMSRSRKKYPISWFRNRSGKRGKRLYNRRFRRKSKQSIGQNKEPIVLTPSIHRKMGGYDMLGKWYVWGRSNMWMKEKHFRK